jgi:putative transposase
MTHELHAGLATLIELLRDGLRFLHTLCHSRSASAAEILFLRKQLAYYQEHQVKPRRLTDAARLSMLIWSRFFDWKEALVVVKPDTFIRWHRRAFRGYWRWKSRGVVLRCRKTSAS